MIQTARKDPETVKVLTQCCSRYVEVPLTEDQEKRWRGGELIQRVVSLSADQRELLISGICPTCWEEMFKDDL